MSDAKLSALIMARIIQAFGLTERPHISLSGSALLFRWENSILAVGASYKDADTKVFRISGRKAFTEHVQVLRELVRYTQTHPKDNVETQDDMLAIAVALQALGVSERPTVGGSDLRWESHRVVLRLNGAPNRFDKGFRVGSLPAVGTWGSYVDSLAEVAKWFQVSVSAESAIQPSSHEQKMMESLMDVGLPEPRRDVNLVDEAGKVYSSPDFAWPEVKLLLDLDGIFWHYGPYIEKFVNDKRFKRDEYTRFEKDARKRRLATTQGWTVITCTDTEIDCGRGESIALQVKAIYDRLSGRSSYG